jgi:hypothetical protein
MRRLTEILRSTLDKKINAVIQRIHPIPQCCTLQEPVPPQESVPSIPEFHTMTISTNSGIRRIKFQPIPGFHGGITTFPFTVTYCLVLQSYSLPNTTEFRYGIRNWVRGGISRNPQEFHRIPTDSGTPSKTESVGIGRNSREFLPIPEVHRRRNR